MLAVVLSFTITLLAGECARHVPPHWLQGPPAHVAQMQSPFLGRFFPFDAIWYQHIAGNGYTWDPSQPKLKQDVAFFPLWPAVLTIVSLLPASASAQRWLALLLAATFGAASIRAFQLLALRLLPTPAAITAMFLFALYPAANFLLESYPTGLMNLLTIAALLALLDGRYVRAAMFSGIVTAAGPLGLGTAMAVCAQAAVHTLARVRQADRSVSLPHSAAELAWLLGLGLLSVSGLLAFLVWQQCKLDDAFAFMHAQSAWFAPLPWPQRAQELCCTFSSCRISSGRYAA